MTAESFNSKCAWGRSSSSAEEQEPIVSFVEIMEEQEQDEGEQEENVTLFTTESEHGEPDCSHDYQMALELSRGPDCTSDEQYAIKLQREFDREAELEQKFEKSKEVTGRATAVLASDSYYYMQEQHDDVEDSSGDEGEEESQIGEMKEKNEEKFPPSGYVKDSRGNFITKHDQDIDEKRSSEKALQLPLSLPTGHFVEQRIGSRVYNELRTFGKLENKRQMRMKDKEEKATSELSVDVQTRLTLLKWINSGEFDRVEGVIATGKESAVLHAIKNKMGNAADLCSGSRDNEEHSVSTAAGYSQDGAVGESKIELSKEPAILSDESHFAVKVYKTTLAGFRNRAAYVKDDFRFKNPRRVMKIWAEKEFLNLQRLKRAKITCPAPLKLKKHILLMSMIGESDPAPKLKEIDWSDDEMIENAFSQVREIMNRMYKECHLVHGDLSEFNLLYHCNVVYVIDLAQAMDLSHPSSLRFLCRDIVNILDFFGRIGCAELPSPHTLFNEITGIEFDTGQSLQNQVESFERENRNVDILKAKSSPANFELKSYQRERTGREDSPSRPYN